MNNGKQKYMYHGKQKCMNFGKQNSHFELTPVKFKGLNRSRNGKSKNVQTDSNFKTTRLFPNGDSQRTDD